MKISKKYEFIVAERINHIPYGKVKEISR